MALAKRRDERAAVYVISVAAELAGVHPQTLRIYERRGLLSPERTTGNTRRYTVADIERLRRIQELTQIEGVNLAGAKMVLRLEEQLATLHRDMQRMASRIQELEAEVSRGMRSPRSSGGRDAGEIVPARNNRSLQQLWGESRRAGATGPIELGPPGSR
jgi:MerR family transcriptional regulator/heat shock protein HspR